jgi:hypothetical protein
LRRRTARQAGRRHLAIHVAESDSAFSAVCKELASAAGFRRLSSIWLKCPTGTPPTQVQSGLLRATALRRGPGRCMIRLIIERGVRRGARA